MVYEARAGEVITLGASSWRIEEIGHDRVTVSPAPGVPGKLPFWHGDAVGRPIELGRAIGAFVREVEGDLARGTRGRSAAVERLRERHDLDAFAAENLVAYLEEEKETAGALPTDRRIVVERFRDELGDWRIVILTPFGGRVHAPWSVALEARLGERLGAAVRTIWSDDGIAIRLPEGELETDPAAVEALLFPEADEVEDLVVGGVASSALFASRFRENAARALLLPRRRPGTRTPLWQQRQRAADLLSVASRYGSFPILVETYRECLADVFDLQALREVLGGVERRDIAVHSIETVRASPFASSLLFDYVAAYMYDGDAPIAERRAQALTLDRDLLRELLGQEELRELLDPAALADLELALAGPRRRPAGHHRGWRPRPAAPGRRPADRRGRRAGGTGRRGGGHRCRRGRDVAGGARGLPSGGGRAGRRRGALDRDRGCGPLSRRARRVATARRARRLPGTGGGRPRRSPCPLGPDPWSVPDRRARRCAGASRRGRSRTPSSDCSPRGPCFGASSGRAEPSASGAIRTSCARCADGRWHAFATRSSRSNRRRSDDSCRTGTASRPSASATGRRSAARRPWNGSPKSSTS